MAELTREQLEATLKTLPISFYTGNKIDYEVSDSAPSTHYNVIENKITFSLPSLQQMAKKITLTDDFNEEIMVRSILYHETSHALLTPPSIWDWRGRVGTRDNEWWQRTMHLFEDERIETILQNFYMQTDFMEAKKPIIIPACQTTEDKWLMLVRFRYCPEYPQLVPKVQEIIKKYSHLNTLIDSEHYRCLNKTHLADTIKAYQKQYVNETINAYCNDVLNLWFELLSLDKKANENNALSRTTLSNEQLSQQTSEPSTEMQQKMIEQSKLGQSGQLDKEKAKAEKAKVTEGTEEAEASADGADNAEDGTPAHNAGHTDKDFDNNFSDIKSMLQNICTASQNNQLLDSLEKIISQFNKKNSGGSALQAYSGVLNPRLCGNENYKFFERRITNNGNNRFGSCHLNLFVDCRGSYYGNEDATNEILRCLQEVEKRNPFFSCDLVVMRRGQQIVDKKTQPFQIQASGGNFLSEDIFEQFRQLQKPMTLNYNIVLFDGDAYSDGRIRVNGFKAFDTNNTTIISDSDNARYIDGTVTNAKVIYSNRYVAELRDNILKILTKAFT